MTAESRYIIKRKPNGEYIAVKVPHPADMRAGTRATPDDTHATCLCGARTHEPGHGRWRNTVDGWWCRDCWIEATP